MTTLVESKCRKCGRPHAEDALTCSLCGELLRKAPRVSAALASNVSSGSQNVATAPARTLELDPVERALAARNVPSSPWQPWRFLALGLVSAPIFGLTPILQYMGWFLASLVHEMGHAALAWLCGMPAIPAISLAGHAAAVHGEQHPFLVLCIASGLLFGAWKLLEGAARWVALASIAVLYPALALTHAKDLVHLLAGHGGELAFATLCLWKTLDGGFTESKFERALYGTVGWYLLGKNAFLCFGLMTSAGARAHYAENGSFGLTNDLIRAAEDVLNWRLESVALLMLVASVLVLPASIALWRIGIRVRANRG